jgi:hypothetical protein
MNKKIIFLVGAIVVIFLAISGVKLGNFDALNFFSKNLSIEEAETTALDFVKEKMVPSGTKVEIEKISVESGLYRIDLSTGGQKIAAYMTKDGKKFFPSAIDMEKDRENQKENVKEEGSTEEPEEVSKSDKPSVELFVMSYCPYGTQAQKGILPAVSALGDKIDFKLKFVDYIMHDKKEIDENLRQFCIGEEDPQKLSEYLTCFLKAGEGTEESCMASASVSKEKVSTCMASADKEFDVTKNYEDKDSWRGGRFPVFGVHSQENEAYGVKGSPALVINKTKVESARDSESYLKTICSAFEEAPEECQMKLSSASPTPGFGEGAVSGATNASCGN